MLLPSLPVRAFCHLSAIEYGPVAYVMQVSPQSGVLVCVCVYVCVGV
jgi:hypothetical protein